MSTGSATRTAAGTAHRRALEVSVPDLVAALKSKLGVKLLAFIVGRDASTLSRWRSEKSTPSDDDVGTMRTAYQVFDLLKSDESDHTTRAWFMGMNPQLDDVSPAEALKDGKRREVMAAARAFLAGG